MITQVILIGVLSAFLAHFINYCIGKPGSKEFSPYEIFSFYTIWLSKRRLKKLEVWKTYEKEYLSNAYGINNKITRQMNKIQFKRMIYEAAEPYFTWERAAGMCVVCSGVWISFAVGLFFTYDFINLFTITLISHITIRTLNRVI